MPTLLNAAIITKVTRAAWIIAVRNPTSEGSTFRFSRVRRVKLLSNRATQLPTTNIRIANRIWGPKRMACSVRVCQIASRSIRGVWDVVSSSIKVRWLIKKNAKIARTTCVKAQSISSESMQSLAKRRRSTKIRESATVPSFQRFLQ